MGEQKGEGARTEGAGDNGSGGIVRRLQEKRVVGEFEGKTVSGVTMLEEPTTVLVEEGRDGNACSPALAKWVGSRRHPQSSSESSCGRS